MTTREQALANLDSLLGHFHCEECNDTGVVALGEHFVTHEMALDAGDPQMEGQSMGIEEGPCPRCDVAEIQQRLACVRDYLAQPEGGDVEEALEAVAALDDIVVEAIYDLVDDGQSAKGPQDYLRDWATIRSYLSHSDGWVCAMNSYDDALKALERARTAVGEYLGGGDEWSDMDVAVSALRSAKEREAAAVGEKIEAAALHDIVVSIPTKDWYEQIDPSGLLDKDDAYRVLLQLKFTVAAAAVERTVEQAKAAMRELAHPGTGMGTHRPTVSPYALDSILAALDSLKETP